MMKKIAIYQEKYLSLSETFIYRQLRGLSDYFDVRVITRLIENESEFPDIRPELVPPRNIWNHLIGSEKRFLRTHLEKSDLFHVNFGTIAVQMDDMAWELGIPMTVYFLGVDASAALADDNYCRKLKHSKFAAVFVNSEDMRRRLNPYLPANMPCKVVYCGIPLERFPFKQRYFVPDGATFLQISRLNAKKGVEFTLKAFRRYVSESDSKAKLIVAGDGPLRDQLLELTDVLKLSEHVSFVGSVTYQQYIELMSKADVFIHPSVIAENGDMEGLPTVICEAMACGLPVVATRHSGIPEIIDDGVDGLLAEERDIDGLYEKMASLRTANISTMSRNARVKVQMKFDHVQTIKVLANHLAGIIG